MSRFSGSRGAVMGVIDKLTDLMLLSIIFLLFCLPVITAGASCSALYYTVNKVYRHSRGYMWQEFTSSFKKNFKQATLTWLLFLLFGAVLAGDLYFVLRVMENSTITAFLNIFFLILAALLIIWAGYVFPYISRFDDTIKVTLKNCAMIAVVNLPWSLLVLCILGGTAAGIYLLPPLAVILPASAAMWQNSVLENVFRKYMSEEDRAAEDERNMEWNN